MEGEAEPGGERTRNRTAAARPALFWSLLPTKRGRERFFGDRNDDDGDERAICQCQRDESTSLVVVRRFFVVAFSSRRRRRRQLQRPPHPRSGHPPANSPLRFRFRFGFNFDLERDRRARRGFRSTDRAATICAGTSGSGDVGSRASAGTLALALAFTLALALARSAAADDASLVAAIIDPRRVRSRNRNGQLCVHELVAVD